MKTTSSKIFWSVATFFSTTCHAWTSQEITPGKHPFVQAATSSDVSSRRQWFQNTLVTTSALIAATTVNPSEVLAAQQEVTDKVFLDIKGLPSAEGGGTKRIIIGLYGKEAPQSAGKLKQLFGSSGLPTLCKPKEERSLQREQLEANKVYNSCMDGQDKGVTYDYAQIWRVIQGERIDFGSVAGRFIAREYPTWEEKETRIQQFDQPGIVSVRKGNDSGFGFSVFPGGSGMNAGVADLEENHIVVGQVMEGLDIIEELNNIAVITTAKVNYMGLTGGANTKSAPSRSCRYGGQMYCNEYKPLVKLTIYNTGIL